MTNLRSDIPADVQDVVLKAVEYLRWITTHVTNENYRNDLDRDGLAINCEAEAGLLEEILRRP